MKKTNLYVKPMARVLRGTMSNQILNASDTVSNNLPFSDEYEVSDEEQILVNRSVWYD